MNSLSEHLAEVAVAFEALHTSQHLSSLDTLLLEDVGPSNFFTLDALKAGPSSQYTIQQHVAILDYV